MPGFLVFHCWIESSPKNERHILKQRTACPPQIPGPLQCRCWRVPLYWVPWPLTKEIVGNFCNRSQLFPRRHCLGLFSQRLPNHHPLSHIPSFHFILSPPPPAPRPPPFPLIWTNGKIHREPLSLSLGWKNLKFFSFWTRQQRNNLPLPSSPPLSLQLKSTLGQAVLTIQQFLLLLRKTGVKIAEQDHDTEPWAFKPYTLQPPSFTSWSIGFGDLINLNL